MSHTFLDICLAFPTVLFTILLGVVLIYWLLVILGTLDIDVLGNIEGDFLAAMGFTEMPVTITITVLTICSWLFTAIGTYYLVLPITHPLGQKLVGISVLLVGLGFAVYLTKKILIPLRPFFRHHEGRGRSHLVGKICMISTSRVDQKFGQAHYDDKGAGLILSVRAEVPNALTKGSRALIVAYQPQTDTYQVISYDEVIE